MTKTLPYLAIIIIIIGVYITYIARETVQMAANAIVWLIVVSLVVLAVSGLVLGGFYIYLILRRMYRQEKEAGLKVVTGPPGHQIYLHDVVKDVTKALHFNANVYSNGRYETPSGEQLGLFQAYLESIGKRQQKEIPMLIEGQVTERQRTVFDLLDDNIHFALIGPTNSGKTTLASHIIDAINADDTYLFDPHYLHNKLLWSDKCNHIIQDYDQMEANLSQVFQEMRLRYTSGPGRYPSILIVLDEWPSIIAYNKDMSFFIERITDEGRKVDVRLMLLSRSDLVQDIGSNSTVIENFIKIVLNKELTRQNQASIRHWDKSKELITLAGPYERQMTFEEQVIDLWRKSAQTEDDITAICKIVYPGEKNYGGNQRSRVRAIIERERIIESIEGTG